MTRRKKRATRLAGSPKHHAELARLTRETRNAFAESLQDDIKKNGCSHGLNVLILAAQAQSRFDVHTKEAYKMRGGFSPEYAVHEEIIPKLRAKFEAACLVSSKLSGMHRRRRR